MLSIYEVAFHLRLPIYELTEKMSYEELLGWFNYFERRPPEWRADDRAVKLLHAQGVKARPQALFSSLVPIYTPRDNGFKQSLLFQKLLGAVGGDKLKL